MYRHRLMHIDLWASLLITNIRPGFSKTKRGTFISMNLTVSVLFFSASRKPLLPPPCQGGNGRGRPCFPCLGWHTTTRRVQGLCAVVLFRATPCTGRLCRPLQKNVINLIGKEKIARSIEHRAKHVIQKDQALGE